MLIILQLTNLLVAHKLVKYGPTESPIPIRSRIVYQCTNIIIRDLEYSESTFSIAEC